MEYLKFNRLVRMLIHPFVGYSHSLYRVDSWIPYRCTHTLVCTNDKKNCCLESDNRFLSYMYIYFFWRGGFFASKDSFTRFLMRCVSHSSFIPCIRMWMNFSSTIWWALGIRDDGWMWIQESLGDTYKGNAHTPFTTEINSYLLVF